MTKWADAHKAKPGDPYWRWYHLGIRPVAIAPLPEPPRVEPGEVGDGDQAIDVSDWPEKDIWECRVGRLCGSG